MIMVWKLATTSSSYVTAIWELNNITTNCLTYPQPSVLPDKWWFNTSQDWGVPGAKFDNVSLDIILDNTLQALDFYLFPLSYLEERVPQFVNVTDKPELAIKPGQEDNSQLITDFEDK